MIPVVIVVVLKFDTALATTITTLGDLVCGAAMSACCLRGVHSRAFAAVCALMHGDETLPSNETLPSGQSCSSGSSAIHHSQPTVDMPQEDAHVDAYAPTH